MPRVVVVGAGVSGLAAAFRVRQALPGVALTVLDKNPRPGGHVWTDSRDGFTVELGPNGLFDANPHAVQLTWAAGATLTACVAGVLPILLTRGASQIAVSQAALTGSMLHLFVALLPALIMLVSGGGLRGPFLYWMLPFYWTTLIALVAVYVRAIKSAPAQTPGTKV